MRFNGFTEYINPLTNPENILKEYVYKDSNSKRVLFYAENHNGYKVYPLDTKENVKEAFLDRAKTLENDKYPLHLFYFSKKENRYIFKAQGHNFVIKKLGKKLVIEYITYPSGSILNNQNIIVYEDDLVDICFFWIKKAYIQCWFEVDCYLEKI